MKKLHKSNRTPPDMAPRSFTTGTYQTVSTMTLTGPSSGTTNDVLYIKHSVTIAGLNKLETQAMNLDIAEFVNVFHTIFNLN